MNCARRARRQQIHDAAAEGEVTVEEAAMLVRSFLSAGVDTTVHGIGNTLGAWPPNPDQ